MWFNLLCLGDLLTRGEREILSVSGRVGREAKVLFLLYFDGKIKCIPIPLKLRNSHFELSFLLERFQECHVFTKDIYFWVIWTSRRFQLNSVCFCMLYHLHQIQVCFLFVKLKHIAAKAPGLKTWHINVKPAFKDDLACQPKPR